MNRIIIVPLIKSPHSKGRIGPDKWQDWYRGIKKVVSIAKHKVVSDLLILSNAQYTNQLHEADLYIGVLAKLGATTDVNIRVIRECYETTEQVNRSFELAVGEKKELVFVSTFSHYPRVQWLIWRYKNAVPVKVRHCIVFGVPRPREMITDIALAVLFPLIDIFGGRQWFLEAVNKRRIKGKL